MKTPDYGEPNGAMCSWKENYVTISKLEFLDAFSSAMAIVGPNPEETTHLLAVVGAIVAGEIFDKQKSDKSEEEK